VVIYEHCGSGTQLVRFVGMKSPDTWLVWILGKAGMGGRENVGKDVGGRSVLGLEMAFWIGSRSRMLLDPAPTWLPTFPDCGDSASLYDGHTLRIRH
jgi:hypothetical protein